VPICGQKLASFIPELYSLIDVYSICPHEPGIHLKIIQLKPYTSPSFQKEGLPFASKSTPDARKIVG